MASVKIPLLAAEDKQRDSCNQHSAAEEAFSFLLRDDNDLTFSNLFSVFLLIFPFYPAAKR